VENRIARAFSVFSTDRFCTDIPIASDNCDSLSFRQASLTSRFT